MTVMTFSHMSLINQRTSSILCLPPVTEGEMSVFYLLLLLVPLVSSQTYHWGPCPTPKVQPNFNLQQVTVYITSHTHTLILIISVCMWHRTLMMSLSTVSRPVVWDWETSCFFWKRKVHRSKLRGEGRWNYPSVEPTVLVGSGFSNLQSY